MVVLLTNNARSTLAGALTDIGTTLSVQTGDAAKFPSPTGDDWFPVTVVKADGTYEIMRCTGRAAAVLTVERAQEGTTAVAFDAGERIDLRLTAGAIAQIQEDAAAAANPPGQMAPFAMTTAPTGWLKANGAAVSRTTYAALFAAIGTTWGVGNGSTTFNLPDWRGKFVRGYDDGRGVDVDRVFGEAQADLIKSHDHTATAANDGAHTHTGTAASGGAHTHTGTATSSGAHTHTGTAASGGAHTHTGTAASAGSHTHSVPSGNGGAAGAGYAMTTTANNTTVTTSSDGAHTHSVSVDSGGAHTHSVSVDSGGAHTHPVTVDSGGAHTHTLSIDASATHTHTITVASSGGAETRPVNETGLWCIKY